MFISFIEICFLYCFLFQPIILSFDCITEAISIQYSVQLRPSSLCNSMLQVKICSTTLANG
jgi:hypothetical protein